MNCHRPSVREIEKRLEEAKIALKNKSGFYANFAKAVGELFELDIENHEEIWDLIRGLLDEIQPQDYAGGRPPQKSYEKPVENRELFAFCWNSTRMRKRMYLKFVVKDGRYYYISLHKSRYEESV